MNRVLVSSLLNKQKKKDAKQNTEKEKKKKIESAFENLQHTYLKKYKIPAIDNNLSLKKF